MFAAFMAEKRRNGLLLLGAMMLGAGIVIALVMGVLAVGGVGIGVLFGGDSGAGAGFGLGMLGASVVILALGVCGAAAFMFAVPLIWFASADPVTAVKSSIQAFLRNLPALIVAALIYVVGAFIASIPFGLGWLVFAPVAIGALYLCYVDVFGRGGEIIS